MMRIGRTVNEKSKNWGFRGVYRIRVSREDRFQVSDEGKKKVNKTFEFRHEKSDLSFDN